MTFCLNSKVTPPWLVGKHPTACIYIPTRIEGVVFPTRGRSHLAALRVCHWHFRADANHHRKMTRVLLTGKLVLTHCGHALFEKPPRRTEANLNVAAATRRIWVHCRYVSDTRPLKDVGVGLDGRCARGFTSVKELGVLSTRAQEKSRLINWPLGCFGGKREFLWLHKVPREQYFRGWFVLPWAETRWQEKPTSSNSSSPRATALSPRSGPRRRPRRSVPPTQTRPLMNSA